MEFFVIARVRESPHGRPVAVKPDSCLGVIVTTQPHGQENGSPQADDGHVDQTRHSYER